MHYWRDGWIFRRNEDGSVTVKNESLQVYLGIPPNEWASIVAAVREGGETTESYYEALRFHMGARQPMSIPNDSPAKRRRTIVELVIILAIGAALGGMTWYVVPSDDGRGPLRVWGRM
ncbi:hypothetical protein [Bradyrhizobium sp. Arg816]|uniref:hypothetical protein n=1 Tax=Bradyrhizobium sp. Arg816 TaxID=2998491 RepID=UPI00249EA176|nr:hypothetical protein [Bradyrhizobium sp. Arg816]MDI3563522.1 hypothetical protein [Bradyrhizobium sp. Arg816]